MFPNMNISLIFKIVSEFCIGFARKWLKKGFLTLNASFFLRGKGGATHCLHSTGGQLVT